MGRPVTRRLPPRVAQTANFSLRHAQTELPTSVAGVGLRQAFVDHQHGLIALQGVGQVALPEEHVADQTMRSRESLLPTRVARVDLRQMFHDGEPGSVAHQCHSAVTGRRRQATAANSRVGDHSTTALQESSTFRCATHDAGTARLLLGKVDSGSSIRFDRHPTP
jgi:hypothetical protein